MLTLCFLELLEKKGQLGQLRLLLRIIFQLKVAFDVELSVLAKLVLIRRPATYNSNMSSNLFLNPTFGYKYKKHHNASTFRLRLRWK